MIAKHRSRAWCLLLTPLVAMACSSGGEQVSVKATPPKDGVVVLATGPMSDVGASNDFYVALDRPELEHDINGTIFDADGTRVGNTAKSPFAAPLLGRIVQDDGNNTVQVSGLECYDASMPGGEWTCGRLRAAVARLDLTNNKWSDYAILDSPLVDLGNEPCCAGIVPLGFARLMRVTGTDTEGIWQQSTNNSAKWELLATDKRVPSSQWCALNSRIYRGPPLALRVGDSFGRVESAAIPIASDRPPQLVWEANGPISNLPTDNPTGEGIENASTFNLGCTSAGVIGLATESLSNRTVVRAGLVDPESGIVEWKDYGDDRPPDGTALVKVSQGPSAITLKIRHFEHQQEVQRIFDQFEIVNTVDTSATVGPAIELSPGDGSQRAVHALILSDGDVRIVEVGKR